MSEQAFIAALLANDVLQAKEIFEAQAAQQEPLAVVEALIVPSLKVIGDGWQKGEISLSQVYMSGRAVEAFVDEALPPADPKRKDQPRMGIAVLEDHHLLGKRIIYSLLRASGYELMDYGRMSVDELVAKAAADKIEILLISTLMLPSALRVKEAAAQLAARPHKPKIVVGGAPFRLDEQLYREVGADATAVGVVDALQVINTMVEGMRS